MDNKDKQTVYRQQLDYIMGRSNSNPKSPPWTMDDIMEFWGLHWTETETNIINDRWDVFGWKNHGTPPAHDK